MSLRSTFLQMSNSASICILHLYAYGVKGYCTLFAHNAITVTAVFPLRLPRKLYSSIKPGATLGYANAPLQASVQELIYIEVLTMMEKVTALANWLTSSLL